MNTALTVIAGPRALRELKQHGFQPALFDKMMAASGGPKWFILHALDRYLFGEFFRDRTTPIHTLGSSAGAWQMACFGQQNPVAAIDRLAAHYSRETYSEKPDIAEITTKARRMVDLVLGESGAAEIVNNPVIQTHILADRCRGPVASETPLWQLLGLGLAASANALSRRSLGLFFQRVIFHAGPQSHFRFGDFGTRAVPLQPANVSDALMASGSIPLVLAGVSNITGAPAGTYRDGGIIDYHFDLPMDQDQGGLVLYPHFSQQVTPGWFDKKLPWRRVDPAHYNNVVMLTPSRELVESLPYQKISDRNDFKHLDAATRLKYWQKVLDAGKRLAEELDDLIKQGSGVEQIQSFPV